MEVVDKEEDTSVDIVEDTVEDTVEDNEVDKASMAMDTGDKASKMNKDNNKEKDTVVGKESTRMVQILYWIPWSLIWIFHPFWICRLLERTVWRIWILCRRISAVLACSFLWDHTPLLLEVCLLGI